MDEVLQTVTLICCHKCANIGVPCLSNGMRVLFRTGKEFLSFYIFLMQGLQKLLMSKASLLIVYAVLNKTIIIMAVVHQKEQFPSASLQRK